MSFPYPYHWECYGSVKCRSRFHAAISDHGGSSYSLPTGESQAQPGTWNLERGTSNRYERQRVPSLWIRTGRAIGAAIIRLCSEFCRVIGDS